jgi:mannosyltransferase OCH1-like enzyme
MCHESISPELNKYLIPKNISPESNKYLIPKNIIPESNKFLIKNKYIYKCPEINLSLVIHYIDNRTISILIRPLVDIKETIKIEVIVFSLDEKTNFIETINIDNSKNYYNLIVVTKNEIIISPLNNIYNQMIPKKIIQTSKSYELPKNLFNSCMSLIDFNPEYEYEFFNDEDVFDFIKKNYPPDFLEYYNKLIPGAYKSDFFRYLYLFKYGGVYLDCKIIAKESLRNIISPNDTIILCKDRKFKALYNAILMVVPKHPVINQVFQEIINRIQKYINADNIKRNSLLCEYGIYGFTGPTLLYEICQFNKINYFKLLFSNHTNFIHFRKQNNQPVFPKNEKSMAIFWNKENHEKEILFIPYYPTYYEEYKNIYNFNQYYAELYKNKNIIVV